MERTLETIAKIHSCLREDIIHLISTKLNDIGENIVLHESIEVDNPRWETQYPFRASKKIWVNVFSIEYEYVMVREDTLVDQEKKNFNISDLEYEISTFHFHELIMFAEAFKNM